MNTKTLPVEKQLPTTLAQNVEPSHEQYIVDRSKEDEYINVDGVQSKSCDGGFRETTTTDPVADHFSENKSEDYIDNNEEDPTTTSATTSSAQAVVNQDEENLIAPDRKPMAKEPSRSNTISFFNKKWERKRSSARTAVARRVSRSVLILS